MPCRLPNVNLFMFANGNMKIFTISKIVFYRLGYIIALCVFPDVYMSVLGKMVALVDVISFLEVFRSLLLKLLHFCLISYDWTPFPTSSIAHLQPKCQFISDIRPWKGYPRPNIVPLTTDFPFLSSLSCQGERKPFCNIIFPQLAVSPKVFSGLLPSL